MVDLQVWDNLDHLFSAHPEAAEDLWLATTKAPRDYAQARFSPDCWLFFGKETAGPQPGLPPGPPGQMHPHSHV